MILSHQYRFIFLKTNKTAGTSIEIALSKFCGPDDIITPIWPADEATRRSLGYPGPQKYHAALREYGPRDLANLLLRRERKKALYHHVPAREVRARVGDDIWNSYFKFCFERNPWDRAVSHYFWRYRSEPRPTIEQFIESDALLSLKRRGRDVYTIGGRVVVDQVCRFERLNEELESIRTRLGIPEPLELPRAKSQFRTERVGYRELLGEAQRERIAELFRDEIELLGYEY